MTRVNPFQPGFATTPPLLVGRDEWIGVFDQGMAQAGTGLGVREVVFYGIRGMGKTALLDEFVSRARSQQWAAVRIEAESGKSLLMSITAATEAMSQQLPGTSKRSLAAFSSTLSEVKVALGAAGVTAEVAASRQPAQTQDTDVFQRLIADLAEVAQRKDRGICLLIDETQSASGEDLQTLFRALSLAHSEKLPVITMFAGLPDAPQHIMGAVSYSERARFVELGPLRPIDTAKALSVPIEKSGLSIDTAALSDLVDLSGGFPYLVQLYGSAAWETGAATGHLTTEHVARAETLVISELDSGIYGARWASIPEGERMYLAAMASLGDGLVRSRDVADVLGKTTRELSSVRQRLINRGMVQTGSGSVGMQFPGYAKYVRYRMTKDNLALPGGQHPKLDPPIAEPPALGR